MNDSDARLAWWCVVVGVSILFGLLVGLVGQHCGFDPASMPR